MSSEKGDGKPYGADTTNSSLEGNCISEGPANDQLSHGVEDLNLDSANDAGWVVCTRKQKNSAGSSAAKYRIPQYSNSRGHARRGNVRYQSSNRVLDNNYRAPLPAIGSPLERGHKWNAVSALALFPENDPVRKENISSPNVEDVEVGEVNEDENEVDDSDYESSDYDSDVSQRSHETRKKNRCFKEFFEKLEALTVEQINDPERTWHCPACRGGPGAIDWYYGLQPLTMHAKTKGSRRVKHHRELAELLDEELRRRGSSVIAAGEAFGKWKGLNEEIVDKEIVWPPMVVIMNTLFEKDENDKWKGMGNQELFDYFSSYDAVKARHSYGPRGHRGISVLIFEANALGYLEAERLSKHLEDEGTDREAWDHRPVLFYPGGKRQLYGYMAEKGDLDIFNKHSSGNKLKFEMKSYQEMVVSQMKQMSADNQQLVWFKEKVAREQKHSKALEESLGLMSDKLRRTNEENNIVRERTKMHHQQNKEEMDFQEQFFKDQIGMIREARGAEEENFEKMQQEERAKVKQSYGYASSGDDDRRRVEEFLKFTELQDKEMEKFAEERDKMEQVHEERRIEMKRRYREEEIELEEGCTSELNLLMQKYTPHHPETRLPEGSGNGI